MGLTLEFQTHSTIISLSALLTLNCIDGHVNEGLGTLGIRR